MLLQEIFTQEYADKIEVFGIDIDENSSKTEYSRPPQHIEMIGFNFKLGEDNLIDEQLLDIIISYKLTNMQVIIEVPSQLIVENVITPKTLIQLASNVDFSISLLPPEHPLVGTSITQAQYKEVIRSFNEEMMKKQNFDKFVAPISNFMEYLMLEKLLGVDHPSIKNFTPDNEYVKTTFSKYMSYEDSNAFKDILRNALYDFYGGEEQFNIVSQAIFKGIYNKSKEVFTEHVNHYIEEQKLHSENTESSTVIESNENSNQTNVDFQDGSKT